MSKKTSRIAAASVARSILREHGLELTMQNAQRVLDDLARDEGSRVGVWYLHANEYQLRQFGLEWRSHLRQLERIGER